LSRHSSHSPRARSSPRPLPAPATASSIASAARSPLSDLQAFCNPSINCQSAHCLWPSALPLLTLAGSLLDDHLHRIIYTLGILNLRMCLRKHERRMSAIHLLF